MGKTLGINDDYWHGIMSFVFTAAVISITYEVNKTHLSFLIAFAISFLTVLALQGMHEAWQLQNDIVNHGSYKFFAANSKRDWKFTFIGLLLGVIFSGIFIGCVMFLE